MSEQKPNPNMQDANDDIINILATKYSIVHDRFNSHEQKAQTVMSISSLLLTVISVLTATKTIESDNEFLIYLILLSAIVTIGLCLKVIWPQDILDPLNIDTEESYLGVRPNIATTDDGKRKEHLEGIYVKTIVDNQKVVTNKILWLDRAFYAIAIQIALITLLVTMAILSPS